MFCTKCGANMDNNMSACPNCGTPAGKQEFSKYGMGASQASNSSNQGYQMQGNQGYPSQGNQGYPVQGNQGYPSQGNQGYPSQGNQGYPSQGNQGYPSQGNQGYPSQGNQGYPSQGYSMQNNYPSRTTSYTQSNNQDDKKGNPVVVILIVLITIVVILFGVFAVLCATGTISLGNSYSTEESDDDDDEKEEKKKKKDKDDEDDSGKDDKKKDKEKDKDKDGDDPSSSASDTSAPASEEQSDVPDTQTTPEEPGFDEDTTATQSEYILEDSSSRRLSFADLDGLTAGECRLARNEIYARHGRMFDDPDLQNYFNGCSWYYGTISPKDFKESMLSDIEMANRDLIVEYEKKMGYR